MKTWGTFVVEKKNKKLRIVRLEDGLVVYSPPNFVRVRGREALWELANLFTERREIIFQAIMDFETKWKGVRCVPPKS